MSRMDYAIISRVIEILIQKGITDEELSFLLGKPNNYVFGFVMKPSDKNRFTEDHLDLLPYLLGCKFSDIFPADTESGSISLYGTGKVKDDNYKAFKHTINIDGEYRQIIYRKKKKDEGTFRKNNIPLLSLIERWIDEGYFAIGQDALQINKRAKQEVSFTYTVSDLEKCLKVLSGTKKARLIREMVDGVYKYTQISPQTGY